MVKRGWEPRLWKAVSLLHHRYLCLTKIPALGNVTESLSHSPREPWTPCWWPRSHICMDLEWLRLVIQKCLRGGMHCSSQEIPTPLRPRLS